MAIGLGLASSHAPALFCPADVWPRVYSAIPVYTKESQPHTAKLETPEVIAGYIERIEAAFAEMRRYIEDYKPDALVVVGDDQNDMFTSANNPAISVFTGDEVWGSSAPFYMRKPAEESRIRIPVHAELSKHLLKELFKRGFDPAVNAELKPAGGRPERGVSHMIVYPMPKLVPKLDIPIIPVFLNAYFPPMPSGQRCYDLGRAIADIFRDRPERIAIYGSGGMSHDPDGPRAGWIDEPLDNWVFQRIERNRGEELTRLFSFDSDTLRGGTGELRSWITAAGACPWSGKKIEYIAAHHAKCGLGWAVWPERKHA
jgi:hypothetical protein